MKQTVYMIAKVMGTQVSPAPEPIQRVVKINNQGQRYVIWDTEEYVLDANDTFEVDMVF